MKKSKILALAAAAALAPCGSSCLSTSDYESVQSITVTCYNRIIDGDGEVTINAANYIFSFDFVNYTVSVTTYDDDIYQSAFVVNDIPMSVSSTYGYTFATTSPDLTNTSETAITDLDITAFYGQYANSTIKLYYTLSNSTTVYSSPIEDYMAYTTTTITSSDGTDELVWTSAIYDVAYTITSMTADMTITSMKLSPDQTASFTEVVLEDLEIVPYLSGMKFTGDSITPIINDVANTDYLITNLTGTIYPSFSASSFFLNEFMVLTFDCNDNSITTLAYTFEH